MTTFTFKDHTLKSHDIDGQLWFESADLAQALEYINPKAVTGLYSKYKSEFTKDMSKVLDSSTSGNINGLQHKKVRVFSLRGVHLIAMLARTPVAEEFRAWVLDLIEKEEARPKPPGKHRGPCREHSTSKHQGLPPGVYHSQSKYNPYRASVHAAGKSVHVGSYPTVEAAVAAIETFWRTGVVQRLRAPSRKHNISVLPLADHSNALAQMENLDFLNHLKTFLEAAQLLSGYKFGKDLAWDLIAFAQEETSRRGAQA